jgi:protein TonB
MLFSKFDVNRIEWLDLVFENRNQSYGAYVLRKESGNYLTKALLIAAFFFISTTVLLSTSFWRNKQDLTVSSAIDKPDEKVYEIEMIKEAKKPEPLVEAATKTLVEDFKQIEYTTPNVVADNLVTTEPPTMEALATAVIGTQTIEGTIGNVINAPNTNTSTSGTGNGEGVDSDVVLNSGTVEQLPEFPGGMAAWNKFLSKNLRYPPIAQENVVMGRVTVSFVVEKNGEISAIKVLKGIGAGCDEEAIRVIKKSPMWKPGFQNGRAVRVSYVIPIVFQMN